MFCIARQMLGLSNKPKHKGLRTVFGLCRPSRAWIVEQTKNQKHLDNFCLLATEGLHCRTNQQHKRLIIVFVCCQLRACIVEQIKHKKDLYIFVCRPLMACLVEQIKTKKDLYFFLFAHHMLRLSNRPKTKKT